MHGKLVDMVLTNSIDRRALADLLFQLADDELCIGHRDSEWLGLAPDIEEDVAFSSIAQDEVGHATFYYELLAELSDCSADALAFARPANERRNALLTERENGDWAHTIVRHFFYDTFDALRLEALADSEYRPLSEGVAKIRREERYHLLHLHLWFVRLGGAGGEARKRMEFAIDQLWSDVGGLFSWGAWEEELLTKKIIPVSSFELQHRWQERVRPVFAEAGIPWIEDLQQPEKDGRVGEHSPEMDRLLLDLSSVYNLDPAAQW
ncbi:ring-1,2-phenylacetyl-CoA epoxidase subunit PaaC [Marininema mesophilum]|uniref:Ring-1,2-phenylacetyl-CoA epoxidase subunit PaaC n=1 Tax=Marininema mesophilum TaxID=1048340 RepID=A0A1H3A3W1_9BACL|nr:1,2-phenylacetyl-CoA epoxidase subunit PaaC [Marininema mesophilum]SDX23908.1 ring-1,2-phenylacetyl-CoA epoxidase subunit PaaC [Marininema mesophilum]